ncbi:hypothetical protein D6T64_04645 [Cryobacterium melibiosiphilum]|uniref:Uncharacterized protein n=1 Tax=Cryobacterium melibiosiphilum TaxID=995039 RepID=A0A3A5MY53_9MICO|nr:hypothetical protein [Cryobacterium melibiosiphilum]RJT90094.1 hypothetical protein D6T64_04645 [Cryobacterium melibiosiphilum]
MDRLAVSSTPAALRLALIGASVAVAWTAVCLVVGAVSPSTAEADPLGLDTIPVAASVSEIVQPVIAPVEAAAVPAAAPIAAPVVAVAAPLVEPVAPVVAAAVAPAAPVIAPVAAFVTPAAQPLAAVVEPLTAVIDPIVAPVAAVTALAVPVVEPVLPHAAAVAALVLDPVTDGITPLVTAAVAVTAPTDTPASAGTSSLFTPDSGAEPAVRATIADATGLAGASVVAPSATQRAPVGLPTGPPTPSPIDPIVLTTTPTGASSHSASGSAPAVGDSPTGPRAAVLASSILSSFGVAALPSAPAFDLGSTPD